MSPVLVTGAAGLLGGMLLRAAPPEARVVAVTRRRALPEALRARVAVEARADLSDPRAVRELFDRHPPQAVIHTAAQPIPAACERDPAAAQRDNVEATRLLVESCAAGGIPLIHCSTDLVFDGRPARAVPPHGRGSAGREAAALPPLEPGAPAGPPYLEEAERRPVGVYAATKRDAEDVALAYPRALVVRLPLILGPSAAGDRSPDEAVWRAARRGEPLTLFDDEYRTPLHGLLAARALWELLERRACGVLHLAGRERVSRWELGCRIARRLGLATTGWRAGSVRDFAGSPPRCPDVSLDTRRLAALLGRPLPSLDESLAGPLGGESP